MENGTAVVLETFSSSTAQKGLQDWLVLCSVNWGHRGVIPGMARSVMKGRALCRRG